MCGFNPRIRPEFRSSTLCADGAGMDSGAQLDEAEALRTATVSLLHRAETRCGSGAGGMQWDPEANGQNGPDSPKKKNGLPLSAIATNQPGWPIPMRPGPLTQYLQ